MATSKVGRARKPKPNPRALQRAWDAVGARASNALPHTVTITIPAELGELVASGLALRDAENTIDLINAAQRFHVAISGLLRKRKG
jgi:hypothetical protein